jgi:hypothetical protein
MEGVDDSQKRFLSGPQYENQFIDNKFRIKKSSDYYSVDMSLYIKWIADPSTQIPLSLSGNIHTMKTAFLSTRMEMAYTFYFQIADS